jgi:hypothetical protein
MAYATGIVRTEKGKHRLHEEIFVISAVAVCVATTTAVKVAGGGALRKCEFVGNMCNQFDRCVVFPFVGPFEQMMANNIPDSQEFRIDAQTRGIGRTPGEHPLERMWTRIILPFFVEFYEDYRPWLSLNVSRAAWPSVWQFGCLVRNTASHGGGKLHIDDPAFAPVTWHSLTYGPPENGRQIFGGDLAFGDIFLLMLEMNDALDHLGCPMTP